MARTKGSLNKEPARIPHTVLLTTDERLEFLANVIVDRILEDQAKGQELLLHIEGNRDATTALTAA